MQKHYPGQVVSGTLEFTLQKTMSYKNIEINFTGREMVCRVEPTGQNSSASSLIYKNYIDERVIAWNSEDTADGKMGPGSYNFPFQVTLPLDCPSSFLTKKSSFGGDSTGTVHYGVAALMTREKKRKTLWTRGYAEIRVAKLVDINKPELLIPVCETKQKRVECLCCNSGEIEFTVSLPRKGFYAGRHFPLTIQTENNSSRRAFMMVEIKKVVLLRGDGLMTDKVKTTAMFKNSPYIRARSSYTWSPDSLIVPSAVESVFDSTYIKLSYMLYVTSVIRCTKNSTIKIPIVVGNETPESEQLLH